MQETAVDPVMTAGSDQPLASVQHCYGLARFGIRQHLMTTALLDWIVPPSRIPASALVCMCDIGNNVVAK